MTTDRGWAGTMSQLAHYLRTMRADRNAEGQFIIRGTVYSFLGTDGENAEIVIPPDAVYFVNGQACNLAAGLGSTSYGIRPIVM